MGSYVQGALIKGESIVYEARISLWTQWLILLAGLILLPAFGLGLIFWLIAYVRYKTTEFAVTNKRVIAKSGFVTRRTVEMSLAKVETVQVIQGLMGRIFNFGTLIVTGAGNPQDPIDGVHNPMEFRRMVMETQDQTGQAGRQSPASSA